MPKRKASAVKFPEPVLRKRSRNEFDQRHKIRCGVYDIPGHDGWYIEIKKVFSTSNPMLKEAVKLLSENLSKGYVKTRWGRTEHVAGMYCPQKRMRAAVILVLDDDYVEIHTAATSRYYMRQALGSVLVALIIEWTRVGLVTRASDQPEVIKFWKSMGFEIAKDSHHSSAPARANENTVFMRHTGEREGILDAKLPKFKPKKMKRIIVKHSGSGRSNLDLFIRKGEVVGSDMNPFPDRSIDMINAIVSLAVSRKKPKQLKNLSELIKKLKLVTFTYGRNSVTLYHLKRKPKPRKRFTDRKYLVTVRGPRFHENQFICTRRVTYDKVFKAKAHRHEWEKIHVKVMNEKNETIDIGHIYRRVLAEKPLELPSDYKPKIKRKKKKSVAANKFASHLSKEELVTRIRALKPDFKYADNWCRYCGAKASSGWGRGPWGSKLLCNSHAQKWRAGKIALPEEEPTEPMKPEESTELGFLRFYLKKVSAAK